MAHQDESAFRSKLKITKVVEVYPDMTGTVMNVKVLVNPNKDVSIKSMLLHDLAVKRYVYEFGTPQKC